MKKIKIILLVLLSLSVINFVACSQSSSSGDRNSDGSSSPIATSDSGTDTGTGTGTDVTNNPVITYIGSKSPSVAKEVGDIVFTDGSATPYSSTLSLTKAQKKAAIAVIFYKGNGLNSDIKGNPDTSTSRTLGIGLFHDSAGLSWCYKSKQHIYSFAHAYDRENSFIQCTVTKSGENISITGDKNGRDNLMQIADDLGTGNDTGLIYKADGSFCYDGDYNYPAFYFAIDYKNRTFGTESNGEERTSRVKGSEFEDDWFLPSFAELYEVFRASRDSSNNFDIDVISKLCGGDVFGDQAACWTSSQDPDTAENALYIMSNYKNDSWLDELTESSCDKGGPENYSFCTCAIREF